MPPAPPARAAPPAALSTGALALASSTGLAFAGWWGESALTSHGDMLCSGAPSLAGTCSAVRDLGLTWLMFELACSSVCLRCDWTCGIREQCVEAGVWVTATFSICFVIFSCCVAACLRRKLKRLRSFCACLLLSLGPGRWPSPPTGHPGHGQNTRRRRKLQWRSNNRKDAKESDLEQGLEDAPAALPTTTGRQRRRRIRSAAVLRAALDRAALAAAPSSGDLRCHERVGCSKSDERLSVSEDITVDVGTNPVVLGKSLVSPPPSRARRPYR